MQATSTDRKALTTKRYCNVAAQALGLDPAGSAGHFEDAVLVETPLPWKREMFEQAGILPREIDDLLALWLERYRAGQPYNHRPLLIAPDPEYSSKGHRRVIFYARRTGAFTCFDRTEYLAPDQEVGPLVWALHEARDDLPRFDSYRVPTGHLRDVLVCTHGTVDVVCAKFGYPLYRHLRDRYASDALRVWRVSHFGGHVFAPTLMEMPTGHYWAYVGETQAAQIVQRTGDVAELRGHYRGWAGIEHGFSQAAEREMWQREGWAWFDYAKSCTVLAADGEDDPRWMELRVDFTRPGGIQDRYEARVEIKHKVETTHSTNHTGTYAYPQFVITRLVQTGPTRKVQETR